MRGGLSAINAYKPFLPLFFTENAGKCFAYGYIAKENSCYAVQNYDFLEFSTITISRYFGEEQYPSGC